MTVVTVKQLRELHSLCMNHFPYSFELGVATPLPRASAFPCQWTAPK